MRTRGDAPAGSHGCFPVSATPLTHGGRGSQAGSNLHGVAVWFDKTSVPARASTGARTAKPKLQTRVYPK